MVCFKKSIRLTACIEGLNDWHMGYGTGIQGSSEQMHGLIETCFQPVMRSMIDSETIPTDRASLDKIIAFYDALEMRSLRSRQKMYDAIIDNPDIFDASSENFEQEIQGILACSSLGTSQSRDDMSSNKWCLVIDENSSFFIMDTCSMSFRLDDPVSISESEYSKHVNMTIHPLSKRLSVVTFDRMPSPKLIDSLFKPHLHKSGTFIAKSLFMERYKVYSNKMRFRYTYTCKPRPCYRIIENDRHVETVKDFPNSWKLGSPPSFALPDGKNPGVKTLLQRYGLVPLSV